MYEAFERWMKSRRSGIDFQELARTNIEGLDAIPARVGSCEWTRFATQGTTNGANVRGEAPNQTSEGAGARPAPSFDSLGRDLLRAGDDDVASLGRVGPHF